MPPITRHGKRQQQHGAGPISSAGAVPATERHPFAKPSAASAQLLHDDGGLVLNILCALDATSLARMCCVCQAWASAEVENRRVLWRTLCLQRWPDLGEGLAVDWRRRYRVLSRDGQPLSQEKVEDPLADFSFVVQGRWGADAPVAFSTVVRAGRYSANVSMHGNELEFRDAFQLEAAFSAPVPLPASWTASGPSADRLDVSILVRSRTDDTVAHLICFSVDKRTIAAPLAGARNDPSGRFSIVADTFNFPTAAGCGGLFTDGLGKRRRTQAPWLTNMIDTFPAGLEELITGVRLEVSPLMLHLAVEPQLGPEPHLRGMRLGFGMIVEFADGVMQTLDGALPLCVKDVPATFEHLDWV